MTTDDNAKHMESDRDIQVLLGLDSYQGMSDTEIQKIVDWNVKQAHFDVESKATATKLIEQTNTACEAAKRTYDEGNEILKKILAQPLNLGKIGVDGYPEGGDA